MEDLQLPPELEQIERCLREGPRPRPSSTLRYRVVTGVRAELRSRQIRWYSAPAWQVLRHSTPLWQVLVAFAASFLITITLTLTIVQACRYFFGSYKPASSIGDVAKEIRQLSPDISSEESVRRAALVGIGTEVGSWSPLSDSLSSQRQKNSSNTKAKVSADIQKK